MKPSSQTRPPHNRKCLQSHNHRPTKKIIFSLPQTFLFLHILFIIGMRPFLSKKIHLFPIRLSRCLPRFRRHLPRFRRHLPRLRRKSRGTRPLGLLEADDPRRLPTPKIHLTTVRRHLKTFKSLSIFSHHLKTTKYHL